MFNRFATFLVYLGSEIFALILHKLQFILTFFQSKQNYNDP